MISKVITDAGVHNHPLSGLMLLSKSGRSIIYGGTVPNRDFKEFIQLLNADNVKYRFFEDVMTINIQNMTTEEKLMAMEMLWDDLCRCQKNFSSPDWHGEILNEREKAVADGKDRFVDWETAKKDVKNSIL